MLLNRGLNAFGTYALPNGVEPLIFADFKNGIYILDGESVALGDIIEENLEFGPWDAELIEPGVGLTDPLATGNAGPCLKDTLGPIIAINDGATVVMTFSVGVSSAIRCYFFDLPEFSNSFTGAINNDYIAEVNDGNGGTETDTSIGASKVVFSFTIERLAGSIGGRPVFAQDATYDASEFPFTNWAVSVSGDGILESVGWYPLQEEADLPSLSA